jgi:serine/threonine-protein kinase
MILQFINGKSIKRYIKQNRLSTKEKIALVTKVLKGFSLIHENSIYHGDIHLSNVLVTSSGQAKIIDFGYSNYANAEVEEQKIRNGGVHAFIPPERALRSIDRKFNAVGQFQSEVYQLGLILYYVFVKELPFKAETWKTMVDEKKDFNINNHEPFLKRRIPKGVRRIIAKSLETNPDHRYANAKDLLIDWKSVIK